MTAGDTATTTTAGEGEAAREQVLETVAALLRDVIGEEYVLDLVITMDTSFNEDLELESIEFVTVADRLTTTYGDRVDFVGFLAEKDVDAVINMTVGEVVTYIVDALATAGATAGGGED